MTARRGKRPALHVVLQATKPLNAVPANAGASAAAYLGCKARKEWAMANRIRAETYMPRAMAFQQAKKLVGATRDSSSSSSAIDSRAGQIFSPVDATKPAVR